MDRRELLVDAIKGSKEILEELEDFAANEGHPNHQVILAVLGEISRLKQGIEGMEQELELGQKRKRDIHEWFNLTYAQYLTVPRSVLQSMPETWQHRFVALLEELDETGWMSMLPKDTCYKVELRKMEDKINGDGWKWGGKVTDRLADYQRGRRNVFAE